MKACASEGAQKCISEGAESASTNGGRFIENDGNLNFEIVDQVLTASESMLVFM